MVNEYAERDVERYDDVFLKREDVQALSSLEAVAAFFSKLGYQVDERAPQTLDSMHFTVPAERANIKRIERIAFHEDLDTFTVYLFEVRSLTVAVRNKIAQHFRLLTGNTLLVLTEDYERLDFVLLERYNPTIYTSIETLQVLPLKGIRQTVDIRAHVLQVERKNTDKEEMEVVLRVLRRFTYTESDTLAQYEKLYNAYIVATWSEPFFNNRALFSDYYLKQRLPDEPEWTDTLEKSAIRKAYRAVRPLFDTFADHRQGGREAMYTHLLKELFPVLGFKAQRVPAREHDQDTTKATPDYLLLDTLPGAQAAPLTCCLAYPWNRNLDGKDERDDLYPDENPGGVMVSLLDAGEVEWAILTNGIVWRLYSAKAHSRATNYYEVNLLELLELDQDEREKAFHYFWLFFRAQAFRAIERQVEGEQRRIRLLDYLLVVSERHAQALGDRLKNRVFEEIFPHFAQGFVAHARQQGLLPAHLEQLPLEERDRLLTPYFTATLTFLYRLLFLFYAESRDLLPVRQEFGYYQVSLEELKRQVKEHGGQVLDQVAAQLKQHYSEHETSLYDRLMRLFAAVDKGNKELNVPTYNGGLFLTNPPASQEDEAPEITVARFLQEHKIPDYYLALGLDRMARDVDEKYAKARAGFEEVNEHNHGLVFIDYKGLGVRHLGSIYEGLLEFKLRIAPEEMAVVQGKRTEEVIAYQEARRTNRRILKERQGNTLKDRLIARGTVYLENDRRERKATGSYYTPDYIVKYIVEQTVGPLLKQKLEALRPAFRQAQRDLEDRRDMVKALGRNPAEAEHETYMSFRVSLNERFFDITVLDPSMGSGHFLVEVVDYVTDQMAKMLTGFKWNPIVYELAMTRAKIESAMKKQDISIEMSKLTDLNLLKRRVLKSCIYGVDLNPMAVELAKVSLWLDCFTLGAPLSFLDHHMKCGNSLLGASVEDVHRDVAESLFGYQFASLLNAAQLMRTVSKLSDVTAEEVEQSRETFNDADGSLRPYKRLFDVWLSQHFGNNKKAGQIASEQAQNIVDGTLEKIDNALDLEAIKAAKAIAERKRFFHWELEFPEIYFDEEKRKPDGGFDAVVGNPPYVRQEQISEDKAGLKARYKVYNSIADLYTYFFELSHALLRPSGRFSMITANKFMRANYGAALRNFLATKVNLEKLIDFGDLPVFEDATAYPLIVVFDNVVRDGQSVKYAQIKALDFESLPAAINATVSDISSSALNGANWSLAETNLNDIVAKLKRGSISLAEYLGKSKINYGIKTGFNEAFVIDKATRDMLIAEDEKSAEIIKPFLVGEDVKRYSVDFKERYLIWTYIGVPIKNYPAIFRHLQQYQPQLEKRWDKGKYWWELRHCDYYAEFEKPKIVFPDIANGCKFALDLDHIYSVNTTYMLPIKEEQKFLVSLLNSSLIEFFYESISASIRGGYLRFFTQYVNQIPIRRITPTTPLDLLASARKEAQKHYREGLNAQSDSALLQFVEWHLAQEPQAADVVRDVLADLADEMLKLNRRKRDIQQDFFQRLAEILRILDGKASFASFTGKSKLLAYGDDYQSDEESFTFDALMETIRKNRSRIGVDPSLAVVRKRIQDLYVESSDALKPVKQALRLTDEMIDAIVYRLYGLTEEEIQVVKGRDMLASGE